MINPKIAVMIKPRIESLCGIIEISITISNEERIDFRIVLLSLNKTAYFFENVMLVIRTPMNEVEVPTAPPIAPHLLTRKILRNILNEPIVNQIIPIILVFLKRSKR